jgi:hypothetical protein
MTIGMMLVQSLGCSTFLTKVRAFEYIDFASLVCLYCSLVVHGSFCLLCFDNGGGGGGALVLLAMHT